MAATGLTTEDAEELADFLRFLSEWLTADHDQLGGILGRFAGDHPYSIDMLLHDLGRFRLLLGGHHAEGGFLRAARSNWHDERQPSGSLRRKRSSVLRCAVLPELPLRKFLECPAFV